MHQRGSWLHKREYSATVVLCLSIQCLLANSPADSDGQVPSLLLTAMLKCVVFPSLPTQFPKEQYQSELNLLVEANKGDVVEALRSSRKRLRT